MLDLVPESGSPTCIERRAFLESRIELVAMLAGNVVRKNLPTDAVLLIPSLRVDHADALAFYHRRRGANRALGCDFFEGAVMKRADSPYPVAAPQRDRGVSRLDEASLSHLATRRRTRRARPRPNSFATNSGR